MSVLVSPFGHDSPLRRQTDRQTNQPHVITPVVLVTPSNHYAIQPIHLGTKINWKGSLGCKPSHLAPSQRVSVSLLAPIGKSRLTQKPDILSKSSSFGPGCIPLPSGPYSYSFCTLPKQSSPFWGRIYSQGSSLALNQIVPAVPSLEKH